MRRRESSPALAIQKEVEAFFLLKPHRMRNIRTFNPKHKTDFINTNPPLCKGRDSKGGNPPRGRCDIGRWQTGQGISPKSKDADIRTFWTVTKQGLGGSGPGSAPDEAGKDLRGRVLPRGNRHRGFPSSIHPEDYSGDFHPYDGRSGDACLWSNSLPHRPQIRPWILRDRSR